MVLFLGKFTNSYLWISILTTITKTKLIPILDNLPENLSNDLLIDHVIFVEKVQKGMDDAENGRVYSKEEARQMLIKWLS